MTASLTQQKLTSKSYEYRKQLRLTTLSSKRNGEKWTIAGRYRSAEEIAQSNSQTPGPGAYSPLQSNPNAINLSPPKYTMTPRRDVKEPTLIGPGPGAYMGPGDGHLKTQISISLQSRHSPKDSRGDIPGPGTYKPENPNFVSPRWTLAAKLEVGKVDDFPGPSQYSPEKPKTTRATLLHGRVKNQPNTAFFNPGPGTYGVISDNNIRPKAPAYSLGPRTTYSPYSAKDSPGPGAYDNHLTFTNAKPQSPRFSITPRRQFSATGFTPGPGAYTPALAGSATSPKIGIGIGDRFPSKLKGPLPGPGAYDPNISKSSLREGIPAFSLTARHVDKSNGAAFPGPGAYSPQSDAVKPSSPRHSLHSRFTVVTGGTETPGPDHYKVQRASTAPSFTLKSRTAFGKPFLTPSPAAYSPGRLDYTIKPKSPAFSLGKRLTYKPGEFGTPGPGAYETAFTFVES